MAELNINLSAQIHAEIISNTDFIQSDTPLILDPLTKSYSDYAKLIYYDLKIVSLVGLTNPVILQNGKNSRFTASGNGTCTIELYIEDELGNSDTDTIIITVS